MNIRRVGDAWVNMDLLEAVVPDKYNQGKYVLFTRGHIITTDITREELYAAFDEAAADQCDGR